MESLRPTRLPRTTMTRAEARRTVIGLMARLQEGATENPTEWREWFDAAQPGLTALCRVAELPAPGCFVGMWIKDVRLALQRGHAA